MFMFSCATIVGCFISLVFSSPLPQQSVSITVPSGLNATLHNSTDIFCVTPAPWWSGVAVFYLANYGAHAATVITYPGEPPVYTILAILYALFFPTSGICRGLNAIFRRARLTKTDLTAAARAGALCMVVRTDKWRKKEIEDHAPHAEWEMIEGAWQKELPRLWPYFDTALERPDPPKRQIKRPWYGKLCFDLVRLERKVHGTCILPKNGYYALAYVPRNAMVESCCTSAVDTSCVDGDSDESAASSRHSPARGQNARAGTHAKPSDRAIELHNLRGSQDRDETIRHAGDEMHTRTAALITVRDGSPPNTPTENGQSQKSPTHNVTSRGRAKRRSSKQQAEETPIVLSSSYSFVKATVAIIQAIYAGTTLYKSTRGPQIEQYGYAAFGLTVTPYLLMSIINFFGNLVTPQYDAIYLVSSPVLEEAVRDHGADIDGTVGKLALEHNQRVQIIVDEPTLRRRMTTLTANGSDGSAHSAPSQGSGSPRTARRPKLVTKSIEFDTSIENVLTFRSTKPLCVYASCPVFKRTDATKLPPTRVLAKENKPKRLSRGYFDTANRAALAIPPSAYAFFTIASLVVGALPIIPIGIISRFREFKGTHAERVWITCWIVFGVVLGTVAGFWTAIVDFNVKGRGLPKWARFLGKLVGLLFAIPGLGGFIIVGKMLREYGNCVNLY